MDTSIVDLAIEKKFSEFSTEFSKELHANLAQNAYVQDYITRLNDMRAKKADLITFNDKYGAKNES